VALFTATVGLFTLPIKKLEEEDVQVYVLPAGADKPDSATVEFTPQTKLPVWETAVIVGVELSCVIVTVAGAEVQPLLLLVTEREYVPATLALTAALVEDPETPGPDHAYVTPLAGPPLIVTSVFVQVIVGLFTILAVGLVV
jgi:hypothetical protein